MMGGMFIQTLGDDPRFFFAVVITVVISICLHELAHGATAIALGDRTPIESGHMTLNPLVHMGPASILCLLLAGIAWGLMPINPSRLRARLGDVWVALAGPLSNVLMGVAALTALGLWRRFDGAVEISDAAHNARFLLLIFGAVNFHLAIFNMLPLPPLDGSRILSGLLPPFARLLRQLETFGPAATLVVLILLFSFIGAATASLAYDSAARYLRFVMAG